MWTKQLYTDFINSLFELQNINYKNFSDKLILNSKEIIGVYRKYLLDISKKLSKTDLDSFLNFYQGKYFEETMILGLAIGYLKDKEETLKYLDIYSNEISDWALCDSAANNLKIIKKNNEYFFPYINKLLNSNEEFKVRFGLIILLSHFINDNYIDYILDFCTKLKSEYYYIKMAISWLLCECYIKYEDKTNVYLNKTYLEKFVLNKTISKICDSYRVENYKKEELKKRRI